MDEVVMATSTATQEIKSIFGLIENNKAVNQEKISSETLNNYVGPLDKIKGNTLNSWLDNYIFTSEEQTSWIFTNEEHKGWNELYSKIIDEKILVQFYDNDLQEFFIMDNQIKDFLYNNNALIPNLKDLYWKIRKYFPFDELSLELKDNWVNNQPKIAVYITTEFDPDESYDRLKKFDKESSFNKKQIFVNVEFK